MQLLFSLRGSRQLTGDKGAAGLAGILPDEDLERIRSHDIVDVAQLLTEEPAVGGVVLAVRADHAGDRLDLAAAVLVLKDHDLQGVDHGAIFHIFQTDGLAARVDVQSALVKVFRRFEKNVHGISPLVLVTTLFSILV